MALQSWQRLTAKIASYSDISSNGHEVSKSLYSLASGNYGSWEFLCQHSSLSVSECDSKMLRPQIIQCTQQILNVQQSKSMPDLSHENVSRNNMQETTIVQSAQAAALLFA